jgi:uncharacterized membrane protein
MADDQTDDQQGAEGAAEQSGGQAQSRLSRVLSKDVLIPTAATALTAAAAGYAAKKVPDLKNMIAGEAKEGAQELGRDGAEGAKQALGGSTLGAMATGASKLLPGGKGRGGPKKTRRLPIQRWTDIAVPLEEAFEHWTTFEEFPKFMHRVVSVERKDDTTIDWQEKIWFSKRQWQGEITDLRENDRIAWKTVSGTSHSGVVSFHRIDDNLTRVMVTVDFQPAGMIEKMASGLRFVKRAVEADLARFKAYVEMAEAEGLEYEAAPSKDEQGDQQEDREESRSEQAGQNGSQPEEREAEREERASRRRERREVTASK